MEELCHIHQAIEIIEGVRNEELSLFDSRISSVFNALRIPRNCSIDSILDCAENGKGFSYNNQSFTFDKEKNKYENLSIWADKIDDYQFSEYKQWVNITPEQKSKFWNVLGRLSYFERDYKLIIGAFEKDFYYHINKSLLNAEYLFLDDYKLIIQEEVKKLETQKYENTNPATVLPLFIKSFIIIASHLCDLCWRIDNAIDEKNNRRIVIETHPEEKANALERIYLFETSSSSNDIYFHFTQSVIEMTVIDHIYKATSDNISKLITLWDRIKNVEKINDKQFLSAVSIIKTKTATLLHQMLEKWKEDDNERLTGLEDVSFFYSAGTTNNIDIKDDIEKYKLSITPNQTINKKNQFKNKKITCENLPPSIIESTSTVSNDIKRYNNWVNRGQSYYCAKSELISKIKKASANSIETIIDEISSFNNNFSHEKENFSPYYFFLVLDFIDSEYKKTKDNNNLKIKLLDLLQVTLNYLKEYIDTYENRMPPVFRPYFEHSFYQSNNTRTYPLSINVNSIKDYPKNFTENSFFFVSYDCNAININRLMNKYEQFIVLYTSWSTEFSKSLYDKSSALEEGIKKQEKSFEEENKTLENLKQKLKEETDKQKDEIKRTQQSSLQTLGLFTGFLAIIVSSIGTFRVATNIWEYIIYSLTYTLAIALFAFLISTRNKKKASSDKSGLRFIIKTIREKGLYHIIYNYSKECAFIFTFVFLLIISITYFFTNHHLVTEDNIETNKEATISIQNSNAPYSMVGLESKLSNDADTINNATKVP